MASRLVGHDAKQVQSVGMPGADRKHLAIERLSLDETTGLVVFENDCRQRHLRWRRWVAPAIVKQCRRLPVCAYGACLPGNPDGGCM